mmetsp:Transcript_128686/g.321011  ORF Transcript_128686/g.321011 Transcript_128686/m.321011 type:complete len:323 (-) Transcript_128686:114-1082(-)
MKDGSAASGAAPAANGLGSYKGVMLCSRPLENASGHQGTQQPPFKSTIAAAVGEQLGLPPPKRSEPKFEVKTRGPSAALRRHCQWIKELQEQVKDDQRNAEEISQAHEQRKERMQQAFKQQRDAIRKIKSERDRSSIEPADVEAILKPSAGSRKPLWAMTQNEKDGFEDEEAAQLIRFVEDLDFDRYIDDLEFKEHLQVVHDRAKKIQREQDAFKDSLVREFNVHAEEKDGEVEASSEDWGGSVSGNKVGGRATGRPAVPLHDERPDWDASTACGDDRLSVDRNMHDAAERLLEANPHLRAVHSKGSVQRLIEKAQDMQSDR